MPRKKSLRIVSQHFVPMTAENVRRIIVGRGLSFDPETLNAVYKYRFTWLTKEESMYIRYLLSVHDAYPKEYVDTKKQIGDEWVKCMRPVLLEDTRIGKDGPLLRKGSRLFENECSFILGYQKIFSPGLFPVIELKAYRALGLVLGIQ